MTEQSRLERAGLPLNLKTHELVIITLAMLSAMLTGVGIVFSAHNAIRADLGSMTAEMKGLSVELSGTVSLLARADLERQMLGSRLEEVRSELGAVRIEQAARTGNVYRVNELEARIKRLEEKFERFKDGE